jgi:CBS domain-containing protein
LYARKGYAFTESWLRTMVRHVKVRDAMSTEVFEISEDATLQAAAKRMADARVNSLVVRPEGREEPFGIITSSDIVDALAEGKDPATSLVGEAATVPLVTVTPGVPVAYAARLMKRANLRHLAVFNGREVVGILSGYDIVKAIGRWGSLAAGVDLAEEAEITSAVTD